jgi:hypothetical protein
MSPFSSFVTNAHRIFRQARVNLRGEFVKIQENQSTSSGAESAGVGQPRAAPWVPTSTNRLAP